MKPCFLLALLMLFLAPAAHAHVGSKDVFETVHAGPYQLFVTIRPPDVIPGIATVEVRATGPTVTAIHITPIPLTGEASQHPPSSDPMKPSTADPSFFTGAVWMMASGSWQVRLQVEGASGPQTASVPVPAAALTTLHMQPAMGYTLAALGIFLVVSMSGLIAAAVRESRLPPGTAPTPARRRRALYAMAVAFAVMLLSVYGGAKWWNVEAATYAQNVYHPMLTTAKLTGDTLDLTVQPYDYNTANHLPPGTDRNGRSRSNADFLPDHGKLIHLYAIREPAMDAAFHLHPTLVGPGDFRMALPAMPPGDYTLYGDVVHRNGFPETLTAHVAIPPRLSATPLAEDDAEAHPSPLGQATLGPTYKLPDGYTMQWDPPPAPLTAGTPYQFHFRLLAPDGTPAKDMQPYLGMAGHAAFVKTDGTVFAHTHPEGSAPMPSLDLANQGMLGMTNPITNEVDFPYGFPTPGPYRIFIQMKHGNTVETGVFDAVVR